MASEAFFEQDLYSSLGALDDKHALKTLLADLLPLTGLPPEKKEISSLSNCIE